MSQEGALAAPVTPRGSHGHLHVLPAQEKPRRKLPPRASALRARARLQAAAAGRDKARTVLSEVFCLGKALFL